MQALVEKIIENNGLTFAAGAVALLLAMALVFLIVRRAFGRRLKTPGNGRARLPRLGVVDAFDLDRQRQLVIVRRDNIEHLLMIGGPNDLVIESGFLRSEGREQRLRDKEPKDAAQPHAPASHPAPAPAAPPWQPEAEPAQAQADANLPPRKAVAPRPPLALEPDAVAQTPASGEPAIAPSTAFTAAPPPHAPPAAPAARTPAFSLPPRRIGQPFMPPRPPREPLIRPDLTARGEAASTSSTYPRSPLSTPFVRPPRQLAETMAKAAGLGSSSATPSPGPAVQPPEATTAAAQSEPALQDVQDAAQGESAPPAPPATEPATVSESPSAEPASPVVEEPKAKPEAAVAAEKAAHAAALDMVDSLEEEMAKLLGRGPSR